MTRHITREIGESLLVSFPSIFDAHHLEKRMLRDFPVEFARQLLEFESSPDPLHAFSADLARWFDREFQGEIRHTTKVESENLGGKLSSNQQWEKVAVACASA